VTRILIIEDNRNLATGLRNNLEIEGHEVDVASDGLNGLSLARSRAPGLIVLDLMLPAWMAIACCARFARTGSTHRSSFSARAAKKPTRSSAFNSARNDYVAKPFGLLELLARVEALLRRASGGRTKPKLAAPVTFGRVHVDPGTHMVTLSGEGQ